MQIIDVSQLEHIHGGADTEATAAGCKVGAIFGGVITTPAGGYLGYRVTRGFKGKVIGTAFGLVHGAAVGVLGGCALGAGVAGSKRAGS